MAGQPTKLTPSLQAAICAMVRDGSAPHVAARSCGIHHQTHYNWMQRGEAGEALYFEYFEAIKEALADKEIQLLEIIARHAGGFEVTKTKEVSRGAHLLERTVEVTTKHSWQAAAWILERSIPERWKNKELSAEDAIEIIAKALHAGDEKIAKLLQEVVEKIAAMAPTKGGK